MKKIITIVSILFITLFSSNIKAQSYVAGPTTVTKGEMNYFYFMNGTLSESAYWNTEEDTTPHCLLYGNELSYRVGEEENLQDQGITFLTTGTKWIRVYYTGDPYVYIQLLVTVVD